MIYIYDLILNWSDRRRYEFFEWEDEDEIEYVKKIPVFRIDNFEGILDSNIRVSSDFLENICNKAEVYGSQRTEKIEYACVFCNKDLDKAIAIEFSDSGESIYKSNIYFLDLDDIFNIGSRLESFKLNYELLYNTRDKDYYLTRKELLKKKYLVTEINNSYMENNLDKLRYIYYELFDKDNSNIEKIRDELLSSLDNDYNYLHDNIYNLMKIPNL